MKQIRWYLETALFLTVSFAVAWLPAWLATPAGRGLGRLCFHLLKRRRTVAIENIEASLPFLERQPGWVPRDARSITLGTFENLGRSLVEDCRIYHGRGRHLIDSVEFRGLEHYWAALAKGKGIACMTAHCGNWDLLALSFGDRIQPVTVVARRQDNPHLNAVLERIRRGYGNEIFYKNTALRAMLAAFKRGGVVGMLIDQAAGSTDGILINFLGRPAWTTRLPAYISRKSATPMLPAFIHREGEKHVLTFYPEYPLSKSPDPEIAAAEDVAGLTAYIERYVVEHPTEWYWIHRRWKGAPATCAGSDPGGVESSAALSSKEPAAS